MTQWPLVPLGEVLTLVSNPRRVEPQRSYPNFGIYSFGRGLFEKLPIDGATTSANTLYQAKRGQFIYSRLFAFEGAYSFVPEQFDGYFLSNEYPMFDCDTSRLVPEYLAAYFRWPEAWRQAATLAVGMGDRRRRIQPDQLFRYAIALPPLAEQQRIVARVDAVATRLAEARRLQEESESEIQRLLTAYYQQITRCVSTRPLSEVAPLTRRPVKVDPTASYPQISARSFGKGTFHQPTLHGGDITWEKPFQVKGGDILISNIKAWEGAIAVVPAEDDGRFSSHRYLTLVPVPNVATARFVYFHLLTPDGLHHVGEASPGSADRNRTTNSKILMQIPVPVPTYADQLQFDALQSKMDAVRALQAETAGELDALLPSVLNKAFAGEL